MSDFSYGEEVAGYQKELAELLITWERIIAMSKAADRLERMETLLGRIAKIKDEVYAAQRGWDQALDALLHETDDIHVMGDIIKKVSENPYKDLYHQAWKLQSEMLQAKIAAHIALATQAISGEQS